MKRSLRFVAFLLRAAAVLWLGFFLVMTVLQGGLLWVDYVSFTVWRVLAPAAGVLVVAWLISRFAKEER